MAHPRDVLGPEVYESIKKQLAEGEAQLKKAQESYDLAVKMGIATAEMSDQLNNSRRRLAQMKAGLGL